MADNFEGWTQRMQRAVETALDDWVPADAPAGLGQAMRYGVLDGGKRLRALLVLAASEAVHGLDAAALRAAVAVELIHAYSLVHDDMPCMDDDVLRRGKPTVHVRFGQARAMLAGDAMQALAFEVLTPLQGLAAPLQARLVGLLARAAGHAARAGCLRQQLHHLQLGCCIVGQRLRREDVECQALQGVTHQQRGGLIELHMHRGFAAPQRIVVHCRHVVVHQRIGVDQFDRGGGVLHPIGVGARDLAGGKRQQRAHALAAAQYRVAHGFMQALWGNAGRGKPLGQRAVHARLACLGPGGKISHQFLRS